MMGQSRKLIIADDLMVDGETYECVKSFCDTLLMEMVERILLLQKAEWLRVRLRVRMVKGSTLTVGNFLSLENLNVIIRAIN